MSAAPPAMDEVARRRAVFGWVMFDWASQPFFTLVTTFVFAPYFATHFVGDEARGQALWGLGVAIAGLTIALIAPVLGSIADRAGPRKPWVAASCVLVAIGSTALWIAVPGATWAIPLVLAAFVIATIGAEIAIVFTNAMMPDLAGPDHVGRLSGLGWAVGYLGGLLSLVLTLGFLAADPGSGTTLIGLAPLFGLDPASHEGARASGPLSAAWLILFALPLFLFVPDKPRATRIVDAARAGLADVGGSLCTVRANATAFRFLIAHMLYVDGLAALFAFGAIYATGVFGWSVIEVGVFGILLTITGTVGALIGGAVEDRAGARTVVLGSLVVLIVASAAIVSIDQRHVFFVVDVGAPTGAGLYDSTAERVYVALGCLIGAVAGPLQSSSRTWLLRLAPADRLGQYFGLYALSGKVTSFMAPAAVAAVTAAFDSARAGISVILVFLVAGLVVAAGVGRARR